jgi:acyl carrier protein phosphodiesterase
LVLVSNSGVQITQTLHEHFISKPVFLHQRIVMNYLAHAVLSFENAPVMVGQFIADDVKGNQWMRYDAEIQRGILLHRFIDDFTDHHAAVLLLKSRLYPSLGKFAGVALDVLFDHCLSLRWESHFQNERNESIAGIYSTLSSNRVHLSEKRQYILDKMLEHDWMNMYAGTQGTAEILLQMSKRIPLVNPLHRAWEAFELHETAVISTFDEFFPELLSAANVKYDTFAP